MREKESIEKKKRGSGLQRKRKARNGAEGKNMLQPATPSVEKRLMMFKVPCMVPYVLALLDVVGWQLLIGCTLI